MLKKYKQLFTQHQVSTTGFTLVELLVAMAVFGILMSLAIGVFVSAIKAQRDLGDLMSVNNNLNLVLEQMSREMRMGYFDVSQYEAIMGQINITPCLSSLSFRTMQTNDPKTEGETVTYSFSSADKTIQKNGEPITGKNVAVETLCFRVQQYKKSTNPSANPNYNCNPWRIGISLAVKPKNAKSDVRTYIETAVSMRVFPIEVTTDPYQCRRS